MEKSFFQELIDKFLQRRFLGISYPGREFIPGAGSCIVVGGNKGASCCEEEARSLAIVKQETEPLLPRAAGRMQLYACRSHPSTPRRCRRLRVPQPESRQGYAVLRYMLLLPDFQLPCYSPFVLCRTGQDALWYVVFYCNGSANKYNADLHCNFRYFTTIVSNCVILTGEK